MTKEEKQLEEKAVGIIDRIFQELNSRAGFDHWWGEVDKETRREVTVALIVLIIKELK